MQDEKEWEKRSKRRKVKEAEYEKKEEKNETEEKEGSEAGKLKKERWITTGARHEDKKIRSTKQEVKKK